jgi:D-alanyl-D-alanine carboxypeptidase
MVIAALLLVSVVIMAFAGLFGGGKDPVTSSSPPVSASGASGAAGSSVVAPPPDTGVDPAAWNLKLVNDANPVGADFQPPEMSQIVQYVSGGAIEYWFDSRIVDTLNQMLNDCNAQVGHSLRIIAGYRSYNRQNELYTYYYNNYKTLGYSDGDAAAAARQHALPAGVTEHQTGLAVDFVTGDFNEASAGFAQTGEYTWLVENCMRYGFILRYTAEKESVTGVAAEPFHFRYVGVAEAEYIKTNNLCLEEYVAAA